MATTVLPLVLGIARCSGAAESPGLRAAFHRNAMLTSPTFTTDAPVESGRLLPNSVPGGQQGVWTMRWDGVLSGAADGELITMAVSVTGGVRLWVHQWKVVEVWDRTVVNATHTARCGPFLVARPTVGGYPPHRRTPAQCLRIAPL